MARLNTETMCVERKRQNGSYSDTFLFLCAGYNAYCYLGKQLSAPKEYIGRRVRIRVEVVDEKE